MSVSPSRNKELIEQKAKSFFTVEWMYSNMFEQGWQEKFYNIALAILAFLFIIGNFVEVSSGINIITCRTITSTRVITWGIPLSWAWEWLFWPLSGWDGFLFTWVTGLPLSKSIGRDSRSTRTTFSKPAISSNSCSKFLSSPYIRQFSWTMNSP